MAIKILIIDDHPAVREALAARIRSYLDLTVCGEAENLAGARTLYEQTTPDLVVVDLNLKKENGIDFIRDVRAIDPKARILVWSMHNEHHWAERALRAGAMGYITKEQVTEQIIDAVRQIMAGKVYLSTTMQEKLLGRVAGFAKNGEVSPGSKLTERELEVFRLIGQGVKTQEIADQLKLSVKTVETHRDRIKKKLDMKDAAELLRGAVLWVQENVEPNT